MIYKFHAHGHPNILGTHKTTLEFTKDEDVSLRGDCIIGVRADFELSKLKDFIRNAKNNEVKITIRTMPKKHREIQDTILAQINPDFDDDKELVIRKTDFVSERTFATGSNKVAFELKRDLINYLKERGNRISIVIENKW